jgi:NAD(P)-dependent dehydrogenase (short-subunit alcohol dehydrogenase family)
VVVNDLGGAVDGSGDGAKRPADRVVEEIQGLGGAAVASYDSVTTEEGGRAIVEKAVEAFGRVDILINNAGILRDRTLAKMEPQDWEKVLQVHLHGAFHVTRPAMLKMREGGYGRIVVTTSAAALFGNFGQTNYSAAKLGVVGLMNTLKLEGEKYNIKVNAVAPIAGTRMTAGVIPPDLFEKCKPEFVVPLVMYLCWEGCEETGMIFNAGMGAFNRSAIVSAKGVRVGAVDQPEGGVPTPEDIRDHFKAIDDLSGAQPFRDAISNLGAMFEAVVSKGE